LQAVEPVVGEDSYSTGGPVGDVAVAEDEQVGVFLSPTRAIATVLDGPWSSRRSSALAVALTAVARIAGSCAPGLAVTAEASSVPRQSA
jgi:hypothetical protein